jgi:hypothetical protein
MKPGPHAIISVAFLLYATSSTGPGAEILDLISNCEPSNYKQQCISHNKQHPVKLMKKMMSYAVAVSRQVYTINLICNADESMNHLQNNSTLS